MGNKRTGIFWALFVAGAVYLVYAVALKWGSFYAPLADTISGPVVAGNLPFGELLRYCFGNTDNVSPLLSSILAISSHFSISEPALFWLSAALGFAIYIATARGIYELVYRWLGSGTAALAVLLFAASSKFLANALNLNPASLGAALLIWGSVALYIDVKRGRISWRSVIIFAVVAWCGPGFAIASLAGLLAAFYGAKGWNKLLLVPLSGLGYSLVRLSAGGWDVVWAVPSPVFHLPFISVGEKLSFLWFNYVHNAMILFQGFYISFFLIGALLLVLPLIFYANTLLKVGLSVDRFLLYFTMAAPALGLLGWVFDLDSGNGLYPGGASFYPLVVALLAAGIAGFSQRRFLGFTAGGRIAAVIAIIAFVGMGLLGHYELYLKTQNELERIVGIKGLIDRKNGLPIGVGEAVITADNFAARYSKTIPPGFGWGGDKYEEHARLGFAPLLAAATGDSTVYVLASKGRTERCPGVFELVREGRPLGLYGVNKRSGDIPPKIIRLTNTVWTLNICDIASERESGYRMNGSGRGPFFKRPYLSGVYDSIFNEATGLAYDPYDGFLTGGRSTAIYGTAYEEFVIRLDETGFSVAKSGGISLVWSVRTDDDFIADVTWNGESAGKFVCEPGSVSILKLKIMLRFITDENRITVKPIAGYETVDYTSYTYRLVSE